MNIAGVLDTHLNTINVLEIPGSLANCVCFEIKLIN